MIESFYLLRRTDPDDLAFGMRNGEATKAIFRAYPQIGVFESEDAFLAYLKGPHFERYGPSVYLGIQGERMLAIPIKIGVMNYEVVGSGVDSTISAACMTAGQLGYVVGGTHNGHLVWMSDENCTLFSLTDGKSHWSNCKVGGTGDTLRVRLLAPGEIVQLRGK